MRKLSNPTRKTKILGILKHLRTHPRCPSFPFSCEWRGPAPPTGVCSRKASMRIASLDNFGRWPTTPTSIDIWNSIWVFTTSKYVDGVMMLVENGKKKEKSARSPGTAWYEWNGLLGSSRIALVKEWEKKEKSEKEEDYVVWCVRWVVYLFPLASDTIVKVSNVTKIPYRSLLRFPFFFLVFFFFFLSFFVFNFGFHRLVRCFHIFIIFYCCSVLPLSPSSCSAPPMFFVLYPLIDVPTLCFRSLEFCILSPFFFPLSPPFRQILISSSSVVYLRPDQHHSNRWRGLWICCVVFWMLYLWLFVVDRRWFPFYSVAWYL